MSSWWFTENVLNFSSKSTEILKFKIIPHVQWICKALFCVHGKYAPFHSAYSVKVHRFTPHIQWMRTAELHLKICRITHIRQNHTNLFHIVCEGTQIHSAFSAKVPKWPGLFKVFIYCFQMKFGVWVKYKTKPTINTMFSYSSFAK
jgi:hypothetical protein